MAHKYYLLLTLMALYAYGSAQQVAHTCATDTFSRNALENPANLAEYSAFESAVFQYLSQSKTIPAAESGNAIRTIPVVVHIVHDFGPENLTDAQIVQAIAWLNDALGNTGSFHQGSGADTEIRLCLAQRTPDNQPTNGITRTVSPLTNLQYNLNDDALKNLSRWNPHDYLNIWVVREICHSNGDCGVGGYTAQWVGHGSAEDGIVIEARTWGSDNAFTPIVAHEIGHYFNLYHTFYQTCSNDNCLLDGDRICDTPPDQSTAGTPCGVLVNSCSNDVISGPFTSDQPDMTWNFMDYGHFACMHDFTADQAARMNFTLSGKRKRLLSSQGCKAPCLFPVTANITTNAFQTLVGQTVLFNHIGSLGDSYEWSIGGQVFGTIQTANFIFNSPGEYQVRFIITPYDGVLCDPDTAYLTIKVRCPLQPDFAISNQEPQLNETVYFQNQSLGWVTQTWYLNGVPIGPELDSLSFSTVGVYEIRLEISDGTCTQSIEKQILVRDGCDVATWQMTAGQNEGFSKGNIASCVLPDSCLIIAAPGESDLTLIKMNPAGEFLWTKKLLSFGLPPDSRNKIDLCGLPDNGFALIPVIIGTNSPRYLFRFDAAGNLLWSREITGGETSQILRQVGTSSDGNILFCGGGEANGFFYGKIDLDGNLLWSHSRKGATIGIDLDAFVELPSGNIIFSGNNSVHLNLIKTSSDGELIWHKSLSYGWNGIQFNLDKPRLFYLPTDHHLMYYQTTGNNSITKLDTNGVLVWTKNITFDAISTIPQVVNVLKPLRNGEILMAFKTSQMNSIMFVAKFDANLEVIWSRSYNTYANSISSLQENAAGGYFFLGTINRSEDNDEFWIQKTDTKGFAGTCEPGIISVKASNRSPSTIPLDLTTALPIQMVNGNIQPPDTTFLTPTVLCEETCDRVLEICNNGNDDDLDGLHDCFDPDCDCENICQTKRNNIWMFGNNKMDFNTTPPSVSSLSFNLSLFPSVICDENGRLLYYSNGSSVLNSRSFFKISSPHPTNGGLLAPHPGDKTEYYCISNRNQQLLAYTIDASLNLTLGEVENDIIVLEDGWSQSSERLTMVNSCNSGYWVAAHELNTNIFKMWHVGQTGIDPTPVINQIGPVTNSVVQQKFSPDGRHMAMFSPAASIYLFDFDPSTGILSNERPLGTPSPVQPNGWKLEFSPNGRFLYVSLKAAATASFFQSTLVQYDLEADGYPWTIVGDDANIDYADIQTGPDGQIYVLTANATPQLGIIRKPDLAGLSCDYVSPGVSLVGSNGYLPQANASDHYQPHVAFEHQSIDTICAFEGLDIPYRLLAPKCFFDTFLWKLEGLAGTVSGLGETATVRFNEAGYGKLIATGVSACGNASDTLDIYIPGPNLTPLSLGPDFAICQNGVAILDAGPNFFRYRWSTGNDSQLIETLGPGKYWVDVWDECGNLQTDTILISIDPGTVLDLAPETLQKCVDFSATYVLPDYFSQWQWLPDEHLSCADCPSVTVSPGMDFSWIITAQNDQGCIAVDTLTIQIVDTLNVSIDTFVCVGQNLFVHGVSLPADTTATWLLPASGIACDTLLTVQVLGVDQNSTSLNVPICSNAFLPYGGLLLPPDTTAVFHFNNQFGCDSAVTVNTISYPPLTVNLPADTTLKIGATLMLESNISGVSPFDYSWLPDEGLGCNDCPAPLVSLFDTQTYQLIVVDANGCQAGDSITISIDQTCSIVVPNAFTPNGDGANDVLRPIIDPCVQEIESFRIVNRWGKTVFEVQKKLPNDTELGWNGEQAGKPQPSDVFIWTAVFRLYDGTTLSKSGEANLLR